MDNLKLSTIKMYIEKGIYKEKEINLLLDSEIIKKEDLNFLYQIEERAKENTAIKKKTFNYEIVDVRKRANIFPNESLEETLKPIPLLDREEIFLLKDLNGRIERVESGSIIRGVLGIPSSVPIEEVADIWAKMATETANAPEVSSETTAQALGLIEEIKKTNLLKEINEKLTKFLEVQGI